MNLSRTFSVVKLLKPATCSNYQNIAMLRSLTVPHRRQQPASQEQVSENPERLPEVIPAENNELSEVLQKAPADLIENTPTFTTPTFNFAAYANKSETIQKLVALGVDLSKIEKKKGFPQYVLKLDFERDIKNHLLFFHDLGVPAESYGHLITKNPLIFKESIEDLETRVYYLRAKKFGVNQVCDIVVRNPFWLSFATHRIDRRLGWFQKNFQLSGDDIRLVVCKQPKLITYNMEHIRESTFTIKEEMGFDKDEMKALLLAKPNFWMNDRHGLLERFDYVHNVMKIPHEQILQSPEILSSRRHRLQQRHGFLKFLGKDQYDATKPGYISLKSLVEGTDHEFVVDVCKSSPQTYDNYLKTL